MAHNVLPAMLVGLLCAVGCRLSASQSKTEGSIIPSPTQSNRLLPKLSEALLLPLKSPRIVVHKTERRLELYSDTTLVRTYKIGLGFSPIADKKIEGDGATPEGEFYVFVKNSMSSYYLSLGISYPNMEDAERGLHNKLISAAEYTAIVNAIKGRIGPPQNTKLGGLIYIHGNGASSDWTLGCVALENSDMKELYDAVEVGTPVMIAH